MHAVTIARVVVMVDGLGDRRSGASFLGPGSPEISV
jgi:hypothetical protein